MSTEGTMSTEGVEEKRGISRRDLIKKGAVAGAIVWTVPFIESVPAYAATGSTVNSACSYFILVYTVTNGGQTATYADRIGSDGSCNGSNTSADVYWCYTCPDGNHYDNANANINQNGTPLGTSGCAANTYFNVNGNTITPRLSNVTIIFAMAHAGSLNPTTGQAPFTLDKKSGQCTSTVLPTKVNVACAPISSATFQCLAPAGGGTTTGP